MFSCSSNDHITTVQSDHNKWHLLVYISGTHYTSYWNKYNFIFLSNELEVFRPGYFLIDRHDIDTMEPHKVSLAWSQPSVLINLVKIQFSYILVISLEVLGISDIERKNSGRCLM